MPARRPDTERMTSTDQLRRLCSPGAVGWDATRRAVVARDGTKPCVRCGGPLDLSAPHTSPSAVTVDHVGVQVSDCIGLTRGEARARLHDTRYLALSHKRCNTAAGEGDLAGSQRMIEARPVADPVIDAPVTRNGPPRSSWRHPYFGYEHSYKDEAEWDAMREQFAEYEQDYRRDCVSIDRKPPALPVEEWERWKAEVHAQR